MSSSPIWESDPDDPVYLGLNSFPMAFFRKIWSHAPQYLRNADNEGWAADERRANKVENATSAHTETIIRQ